MINEIMFVNKMFKIKSVLFDHYLYTVSIYQYLCNFIYRCIIILKCSSMSAANFKQSTPGS